MKSHTLHTESSPHEGDKEKKESFTPIISPEKPQPSDDENLKTLIEKNIKWSQVIYQQNRKIQRRLSWIVFGSYFKLFLILIPIIIGLIYLPPLVSDFATQYGHVFGNQELWANYLEVFKSSQ